MFAVVLGVERKAVLYGETLSDEMWRAVYARIVRVNADGCS